MTSTINPVHQCHDCNTLCDSYGIHKPWGRTHDGKVCCHDCCHKREEAEFLLSQRYTAYLSGDAKRITTWPGGQLARVMFVKRVRHNMAGYVYRVWAKDSKGREWYSQCGIPGQVIRLRLLKWTLQRKALPAGNILVRVRQS
jgi:hypothetical protein